MLKRFASHFDNMVLAIVIWMCLAPLVGLLVFPFFGARVSLLVAVGLLIVALIVCRRICSWKIFNS